MHTLYVLLAVATLCVATLRYVYAPQSYATSRIHSYANVCTHDDPSVGSVFFFSDFEFVSVVAAGSKVREL